MRHGFSAAARPPRLVLRCAVYAALTLALASSGFLWYVHRYATTQAKHAVHFHARFVADTILRGALHPGDFRQRAGGSRLEALDDLFRREVLVGGAVRVKLYGRDGRVTYSNEHELIGRSRRSRTRERRSQASRCSMSPI